MATKWTSEFGGEFDDYEDAWQDCNDNMELCDWADFFHNRVSYESLFTWCLEQPAFWDHFQDDLDMAQQEYFDEYYTEIEVDDEEEEED